MSLYKFQEQLLCDTWNLTRVAYYLDMGLGKTFVGAEKLDRLGNCDNLLICQKSKIDDWINHFETYYPKIAVYDLTKPKEFNKFWTWDWNDKPARIGIINYDLIYRRADLTKLKTFTLMLDESSLIQNDKTKRAKFVMNKLRPKNVILLSGTPVSGRYEKLWSQLKLLGWNISKKKYWDTYVRYTVDRSQGFPLTYVHGYKNVDDLKQKLHDYGARFMKSDEVLELPEQIFTTVNVDITSEYKRFKRDSIITIDDTELVGDNTLNKMLYQRMLCGQYNKYKIEALRELIQSSEDRIIVFYNFNSELDAIFKVCESENRYVSLVNGHHKDLMSYENDRSSVTAIQYQAGSMGLNLQKANKIVYFTPPLSSDLFEQSKKRIHRIGQSTACFYYLLTCKDSIETKIYRTLAMRRDYTNALFEKDSE